MCKLEESAACRAALLELKFQSAEAWNKKCHDVHSATAYPAFILVADVRGDHNFEKENWRLYFTTALLSLQALPPPATQAVHADLAGQSCGCGCSSLFVVSNPLGACKRQHHVNCNSYNLPEVDRL